MTMPMGPHTPPVRQPISGPHVAGAGAPSAGSHAAAPPHALYPMTLPGAFTPVRGAHKTVRMAQRPHRPKAATIVVRPRGPSTFQKLAAFVGMLLLVIAFGMAVIVWRKPVWLGFAAVPREAPAGVTVVPAASAQAGATSVASAPSMNGPMTAASAGAGAAPSGRKPVKH